MQSNSKVIVLDPGHGGAAEAGGSSPNNTSGGGLLEKDLTLDVARRVRARLGDRAKVLLTRDTDSNLSLSARAGFARAVGADVFLSLHCNGHPDPSYDSSEVYIARDADERTRVLARTINDRLRSAIGAASGDVVEADLGVLLADRHAPQTRAALVELFDLTNPSRATAAADVAFLDLVAETVAEAVASDLSLASVAGFGATAFREPSSGDRPPGDWSPQVQRVVQRLTDRGVPADEVEDFLAQIEAPTPAAASHAARSLGDGEVTVELPPGHIFEGWQGELVTAVIATTALGPLLPALHAIATSQDVTIGIGPAVSGGLVGGAGLSVGIVVAPGDQLGFYGSVAGLLGAVVSISRAMQVTVVFGGPSVFSGSAVGVGITVDTGVGPQVGAHLLMPSSGGDAIGVIGEVGLSAGLSPFEAFAQYQHTWTTLGIHRPATAFATRVRGARSFGRSWIILGDDLTPEAQAFHPSRADKSGAVSFSVRVPDLPAGGRVRWSVPPGERGVYTLAGGSASQDGTRADVTALRPGMTEIDVSVQDGGGTTVESWKLPLSIPQFVRVERTPAFDALMTREFGLIDEEVQVVLDHIKSTADRLLTVANVRTVWTEAPFSEAMPSQFRSGGAAAANVSHLALEGEPPKPNVFGSTERPNGPTAFGVRMHVYPGAYDDPIPATVPADGIDELTAELLMIIAENANMSSVDKSIAMQVIGRLIGETVAHEIGHSVIGAEIGAGNDRHNQPDTPDGIMNQGGRRTLTNRTGFEVLVPASGVPLDEMLQDRGPGAINTFRGPARASLDRSFPVPPVFSGTLGRAASLRQPATSGRAVPAAFGRSQSGPDPLTDAEWDLVTAWLAAGAVHGEALTGDAEDNAILVAGAIWCGRGSDPGSCQNDLAIVSHPDIEALVPIVTERGPIIHWPARSLDERRVTAMELLVAAGYRQEAAAGVVGNLEAESGVIPSRIEGSQSATPLRSADFAGNQVDWTPQQVMDRNYSAQRGPRHPGVGLAQWTSAGRRSGLFTHSVGGRVPGPAILFDLAAQIDYLVHELQTSYPGVERVLRDPTTTVHDAANEVVYDFEVPGAVLADGAKLPRTDPAVQEVFENRRRRADRALQAYQNAHPAADAQGLGHRRAARGFGSDDHADVQALERARAWARAQTDDARARRTAIGQAADAEYRFWAEDPANPDVDRIEEGEALPGSGHARQAELLARFENYARSVGRDAAHAGRAAGDNWAWSAAFVSHVMLQGGATADLGFQPSAGHSRYTIEALCNRLNRDHSRPFWLHRLDEVPVEVGDIIVKARPNSQIDFDRVFFELSSGQPRIRFRNGAWAFGGGEFVSHADIVVDAAGGRAFTVGGNTRHLDGTINVVGKRRYELDGGGHVVREVDAAGNPHPQSSPWAIIKMLGATEFDRWVELQVEWINAMNGANVPSLERNTFLDVFGTGDALPNAALNPAATRRAIFPDSRQADLGDIDLTVMFTPRADPIPSNLA